MRMRMKEDTSGLHRRGGSGAVRYGAGGCSRKEAAKLREQGGGQAAGMRPGGFAACLVSLLAHPALESPKLTP